MNRIRLCVLFFLLAVAVPASAFYVYEQVGQMWTTGRLVDLAWHPDGDHALIIESGGMLLRVEVSVCAAAWVCATMRQPWPKGSR